MSLIQRWQIVPQLARLIACQLACSYCPVSLGFEVTPAFVKQRHEEYRRSIANISYEMQSSAVVPGREIKAWVKSTACPAGFAFTAGVPAEGEGRNAQGANSQYSFRLSRASKTTPWKIDDLTLFTSDDSRRRLRPFSAHIDIATDFLRIPLHELLADENCHVEVVASTSPAGTQALRLRVNCDRPLKHNKLISRLAATIDLYSTQYPIIQRCSAEYVSEGVQTTELVLNEFKLLDGIPVLAESRSDVKSTGGQFIATWSFDGLSRADCSADQTPFTLTAFGLPEPPGTTVLHKQRPYWAIGTGGGVLLVVIGFYLRHRATGKATA